MGTSTRVRRFSLLHMALFVVRLVPLSAVGCRKPLRSLDQQGKAALMHSIGSQGLLQPIVCRQDGGRFEILDGVHRWQACLALGWEEVPIIVLPDLPEDVDGILSATEMNLVRRDLSPIDKARCMQQWIQVGELRQAEIAKRVGVSETKVSKLLSLGRLPAALQELVHSGALPETTAYDLVRKYTPEELEGLAVEVLNGGVTNKQVVSRLSAKSKRKAAPKAKTLQCDYGLHLTSGRFVALVIPSCAGLQQVSECLRDALAEIESRQQQGAKLEDFTIRTPERPIQE